MKIVQSMKMLEALGVTQPNRIYWQLNTPQLYEEAVQRHEGYVAHLGPLAVRTGNQTSLAHSDRFIVSENANQGNISWGEINRPFDSVRFDELLKRIGAYYRGMDLFVQDVHLRRSSSDRMPVRVVTETAWHNLFVRNSYLPVAVDELDDFYPEFTVLHAPGFRAVPARDGTNSDVFVIIHLMRKLILIGGTSFAGEIEKAIFSVMNYLLPRADILTMECSANIGDKGDVALFMGIDGSGKTTLATDPNRTLLGDSEHGWDEAGVFSINRGCYAHALNLNEEESAEIWQVTRRFGTLLENVVMDVQTRHLQLGEGGFTENTRVSYPISHLLNATRKGVAGHPRKIFLLSKDGFGVLPLVSKLTIPQAHYYFLSGYTCEMLKDRYGDPYVAAKFSSCYGAPFMPLHPGVYAGMFKDRLQDNNVEVWMLNTGWMGGAYGVGKRVPLEHVRTVINNVLNNRIAEADMMKEPVFGLMIPKHCYGVPDQLLNPMENWPDEDSYMTAARKLIKLFDNNFAQYHDEVDPAVLAAQPSIG